MPAEITTAAELADAIRPLLDNPDFVRGLVECLPEDAPPHLRDLGNLLLLWHTDPDFRRELSDYCWERCLELYDGDPRLEEGRDG